MPARFTYNFPVHFSHSHIQHPYLLGLVPSCPHCCAWPVGRLAQVCCSLKHQIIVQLCDCGTLALCWRHGRWHSSSDYNVASTHLGCMSASFMNCNRHRPRHLSGYSVFTKLKSGCKAEAWKQQEQRHNLIGSTIILTVQWHHQISTLEPTELAVSQTDSVSKTRPHTCRSEAASIPHTQTETLSVLDSAISTVLQP